MPMEIRELVVRGSVGGNGRQTSSARPGTDPCSCDSPGPELSEGMYEELITRVLERLREREER